MDNFDKDRLILRGFEKMAGLNIMGYDVTDGEDALYNRAKTELDPRARAFIDKALKILNANMVISFQTIGDYDFETNDPVMEVINHWDKGFEEVIDHQVGWYTSLWYTSLMYKSSEG